MNRSVPLVAVACLLLAGCSSSGTPAVTVDQDGTLVDQPVHLKVTGAPAGKPVQVGSEAVDADGKKWHAEATFVAGKDGTVNLDSAAPTGGSYQGADGMGLFWSMNPPDGDLDSALYVPPVVDGQHLIHVDVFVSSHGKRVASTTITRRWMSPGVTTRPVPRDLTGAYVVPKPDGARHPAVLLLGGSEGGVPSESSADLLASHGYPVLRLAYFHAPGRPEELRDVPLEYLATAARWLGKQPEVDPAKLVVMGTSYGSVAALLLADHFPTLVHGTILFAPGALTITSFPHEGGAAWTYRGKPLAPAEPIPVDAVNGPVLAVAGSADALWDSPLYARSIMRALDAAHDKYPHEAVIVDGAGHAVGGTPYLPHGTRLLHPIVGRPIDFGGTRAATESAQRQGWTKALALLASLRH